MSEVMDTPINTDATVIPDPPPVDIPAKPESPPSPNPPAETKPKPAGTNTLTTNIGVIEGEAKFASIIQEIEIFFSGSANRKKTRITLNEFWRITDVKKGELAKVFVADQDELECLRKLLNDKRVLILRGEADLGKASTAIYLAHSMAEYLTTGKHEAETEGEVESLETYMIPTPGPYDSIDWDEIWPDGKEDPARFVIFKDAFADRNQDLLAFVRQLKEFSLDRFANKLRKKNSYLVLTTATSELPLPLQNSLMSGACHELQHLSEQLLTTGLIQRLDVLSTSDNISTSRLAFIQQPAHTQVVIAQLKTMPRIVRFVEQFLNSTAIDTDLNLEDEIRRFEDIGVWFQRELTKDFEFWCFTLSLALVHWQRNGAAARWYEFEKIRRSVRSCLRGDPELFPPRKYLTDEPLNESRAATVVLIDDVFLEKCRAKIEKDPYGLGDQIFFKDPSYSQKLWDLMLRHHRRVLGILLKHFCEVAGDPETDYETRELYAQIIGRIGEIDPDRITVTLIDRWVNADDVRLRAAVAALYEGILASNDERYQKYLLTYLDTLTDSESQGREEKNRLLTAIAVYARVGNHDLALAMNGLKRIVLRKLAPAMRDANNIQTYLERTEHKYKGKLSAANAVKLTIYQEMLKDWAERMYNQQSRTFVGVQYALCSLALNAGPIKVFRELRRWIETSDQQTGGLIALMFLFKDGIAETLGTAQLEISLDESSLQTSLTASPILLALTSDHESVVEMDRFLVTLYESFTASFVYPRQFSEYLKTSLMFQLSLWIEAALGTESYRKAMEELLSELVKIHNSIMFDPIYRLLQSDDLWRKHPELKQSFVKRVFW
jgi:hypothetical protein